jgi:hypothetical protein
VATTLFCSIQRRLSAGKRVVCRYGFVNVASDPVQGSLKSDRGSRASGRAPAGKTKKKTKKIGRTNDRCPD